MRDSKRNLLHKRWSWYSLESSTHGTVLILQWNLHHQGGLVLHEEASPQWRNPIRGGRISKLYQWLLFFANPREEVGWSIYSIPQRGKWGKRKILVLGPGISGTRFFLRGGGLYNTLCFVKQITWVYVVENWDQLKLLDLHLLLIGFICIAYCEWPKFIKNSPTLILSTIELKLCPMIMTCD